MPENQKHLTAPKLAFLGHIDIILRETIKVILNSNIDLYKMKF